MTATYIFDLADHRGNAYFAIYKKIILSTVRMASFWAALDLFCLELCFDSEPETLFKAPIINTAVKD